MTGIPIKESPLMIGARCGLKTGGIIWVSPAMYSLIKNANPRELEALLKTLMLRDLDAPPEHDPQWHADTWQIMAAKFGVKT